MMVTEMLYWLGLQGFGGVAVMMIYNDVDNVLVMLILTKQSELKKGFRTFDNTNMIVTSFKLSYS